MEKNQFLKKVRALKNFYTGNTENAGFFIAPICEGVADLTASSRVSNFIYSMFSISRKFTKMTLSCTHFRFISLTLILFQEDKNCWLVF